MRGRTFERHPADCGHGDRLIAGCRRDREGRRPFVGQRRGGRGLGDRGVERGYRDLGRPRRRVERTAGDREGPHCGIGRRHADREGHNEICERTFRDKEGRGVADCAR